MWRKPNLITEDVDSLLKDTLVSVNNYPTPVPVPTPAPPPGWEPPKRCILERCTHGNSCDIFPVF